MIELYNCDCMEIFQSQKLKFRNICIVSDPPFNIGYKYDTYRDRMDETQYFEWLSKVFSGNGFPFVVVHYPEPLYKISHFTGIYPEKVCTWVYNSNNQKQHRDIAYFGIKPDMNQMKQPYKNPNDKRIKKLIESGKDGARLYDWWNINQVKNVSKEKTEHPCQMPIEVMRNVVGVIPKDYIIFDPFMGSGTTGVACAELGYDFIGTELDEKYFEIATKRIDEAIKNKGESQNGIKSRTV